ncbi:hypothetical protein EDD85DRAFT_63761 [Armillaria nabsnona]|nr:hypothetical protein EDD85DRAFT_63761 [Armillaria nabsnona]
MELRRNLGGESSGTQQSSLWLELMYLLKIIRTFILQPMFLFLFLGFPVRYRFWDLNLKPRLRPAAVVSSNRCGIMAVSRSPFLFTYLMNFRFWSETEPQRIILQKTWQKKFSSRKAENEYSMKADDCSVDATFEPLWCCGFQNVRAVIHLSIGQFS